MKKAISTKTKKKVKRKRSKKNLKEVLKRKEREKTKEKKKIRPVVVEAIITKGGGYSLKYVRMCCEFASVVSELIAVIGKSSLFFLIWGLFGSRDTPQLSLRGKGIYQKKQRSKST